MDPLAGLEFASSKHQDQQIECNSHARISACDIRLIYLRSGGRHGRNLKHVQKYGSTI